MPNVTQGFLYSEIVTRVKTYIGNESAGFQTYVEQTLPLAEFRFCKMHDWGFLRKTGLVLTTQLSTAEYTLEPATIGYHMAATDVETIRAEVDGVVLKRMDLNQIRRFDVENDDGSAQDTPMFWAPASDNKIRLWPPSTKAMTLQIDGKITPVPPSVLSAEYPTIPYKFQESFIEYVIAMALDRENDDRAQAKKQEALALIREDIKADLANLSDVENPRIKSLLEARFDGLSDSLDVPGFGPGE